MKRLYWRPQRVSRNVLVILALTSIGGLVAAESVRIDEQQPYHKEKLVAAKLALSAFRTVKDELTRRGITLDPESDPTTTGLIGELLTPVTTNPGHLPAKQTAMNPNFAGVVVHLLKRAGVDSGDTVAVGFSGSFPAINICVLAAIEVLELRPLVVSSAGASQWGANRAMFMWPDIEKLLADKHIFSTRSLAMSRGGVDDRALGLSKNGRQQLDDAITRNGYEKLAIKSYGDGLEQRMAVYNNAAGGDDVVAYINVGGGTTSVGTRVGKRMFKPGLNRRAPRGAADFDSVMTRFAGRGVPILHFIKIDSLAERYGLPLQPQTIPPVGEGKIFVRSVRSDWLTAAILVVLITMLFAFVRLDWGYRLLAGNGRQKGSTRPEQVV